jgi:hypothetical protein
VPTVSGIRSKVASSVLTPVAKARPVVGHRNINTPICPSLSEGTRRYGARRNRGQGNQIRTASIKPDSKPASMTRRPNRKCPSPARRRLRLRPFVEARNGGVGPISGLTWWIGRVKLGPILSVGGPGQSPGWGLPARGGSRNCVMDGMQNPTRRANRGRELGTEYSEQANDAASPFL